MKLQPQHGARPCRGAQHIYRGGATDVQDTLLAGHCVRLLFSVHFTSLQNHNTDTNQQHNNVTTTFVYTFGSLGIPPGLAFPRGLSSIPCGPALSVKAVAVATAGGCAAPPSHCGLRTRNHSAAWLTSVVSPWVAVDRSRKLVNRSPHGACNVVMDRSRGCARGACKVPRKAIHDVPYARRVAQW